jgi:hypothetical protein
MPELKQLRGVRAQEYYEDEELQDAVDGECQGPLRGIALADRRDGQAPKERKPRRAHTGRALPPTPPRSLPE